MNWIDKILPTPFSKTERTRSPVPEGVWFKCAGCKEVLYKVDLIANQMVCMHCNHHMKIKARDRVSFFLDSDGCCEIGQNILPSDILRFHDSEKYVDRLRLAKLNSGENEVLIVMSGTINQYPVVVVCFEFEFMGGSMGSVVGERFTRAVEYSIERKVPFICFSASGGARMQEGLTSLMQMAKTNAALTKLEKLKIPFISVLTHPTMGGVSASFAFMGDIVIAEPNALIGFAGQRVISNTVKEILPDGFQRAEFLMSKGAIDLIVDRHHMKETIYNLLTILKP